MRNFKELMIWQKGLEISIAIYELEAASCNHKTNIVKKLIMRNFKELLIWKKGIEISVDIYELEASSCKLLATSYKLQASSLKLQAATIRQTFLRN